MEYWRGIVQGDTGGGVVLWDTGGGSCARGYWRGLVL